ncbi:Uncharacterised protein [Mycobacteroides abscessus subsp. abscessus]|nr:Uncharacterised protein [Mycobacteroides abscessus subsp. abscessus]
MRVTTVTMGTVASITARKNRPPRLMTPLRSSSIPGSTPGVSTTNTSGRPKASQSRMKWVALSEHCASSAPPSTCG